VVAASHRTFFDSIKDGIAIVRLDEDAMKRAAQDPGALWHGVGIVAIGGVAIAFGMLQPWMVPMLAIAAVIGSIINIGIIHLLSLLFGGSATFGEFYRARALSSVILWPMVIPIVGPFLGIIIGFWDIIVNIVTIRAVHNVSTIRAVFVVLIPIILFTVAVMFLAMYMLFAGADTALYSMFAIG